MSPPLPRSLRPKPRRPGDNGNGTGGPNGPAVAPPKPTVKDHAREGTASAIGWKWALKCTVDLRPRICTSAGSTPTWRNISWSVAWMRLAESTADTPLAASVTSAIGPM